MPFFAFDIDAFAGAIEAAQQANTRQDYDSLAVTPVRVGYGNVKSLFGPKDTGRRLRVLARLVYLRDPATAAFMNYGTAYAFPTPAETPPTYGGVYAWLQNAAAPQPVKDAALALSRLRYRPVDPNVRQTLAAFLQDMADDFIIDVRDAAAALDNPDLYYPGIDPPQILPVPDEHVHRVIAVMQKELDNERRDSHGGRNTVSALPAVPLGKLPFRVQRALIERRRWRYHQFGIGPAQFEAGLMSLWDIHEDPDWRPRST